MVVINGSCLHTPAHMPATAKPLDLIPEWETSETSGRRRRGFLRGGAYRPPAFGVGGFSDKFNSLHTYGLAVDMRGIGRPGSRSAVVARDRCQERRRLSLWS
jgi:hypothetical protein